MIRADNWRTKFYEAIELHRYHAFQWGKHDCAILTADCIAAVIGVDLAETFRDQYATKEESDQLLSARGFTSTVQILEEHFTAIHPLQAIVGDVAVIEERRRAPAVAPVVGAQLVVFAPGKPIGLVPLTMASRAFRVEIKES